MPFSKPPAVKPGDVVRVIAPSGSFDRESFEAGLAVLSRRYKPVFDEGLFARHRYLAGDDDRRLEELEAAFKDPTAKAVFCARGGYGSTRLLGRFEFRKLPQLPLVGFSDTTALHLALARASRVSFHGPVVTQLGRLPEADADALFSLLEARDKPPTLEATDTLVEDSAEGVLMGGNLAVLTRLIGTPYMPDLSGSILLLEDIGERPYRLDRMFTHLETSGAVRNLRGIALGTFTNCEEKDADYTSLDVLRDLVARLNVPCAAGFPIGHGERNAPVALGTRARLDASARKLEFLEAGVA